MFQQIMYYTINNLCPFTIFKKEKQREKKIQKSNQNQE